MLQRECGIPDIKGYSAMWRQSLDSTGDCLGFPTLQVGSSVNRWPSPRLSESMESSGATFVVVRKPQAQTIMLVFIHPALAAVEWNDDEIVTQDNPNKVAFITPS